MIEEKMVRGIHRITILLLAYLFVFTLSACGKDEDPSDGYVESSGEVYDDSGSYVESTDDSYGGFGEDDFSVDSSERRQAVAADGQYKTVFHRTNESEGIDVWCYLVWDEDGGNVRMVFFGKEDEGEISFTEMDDENYYGKSTGNVKINGKTYDNTAEFSMQSHYEGYANMQIQSAGDETEYLGLDGVVSIEKIPARYSGYFFGTYLDPLMVLSGDDYRIMAELSNSTDSYTVDNIFYCCSVWDDVKQYSLRNLDSLTYREGGYDDFSVYVDEREDYDKTIYLTWLRYGADNERIEETQDFSTYYYYFYDHKAPADFENHDGDGKWGRISVNAPEGSFEPLTDDYIINHETSSWSGYDDATSEYKTYDVEYYDLYSFDETGKCVQDVRMVVFPGEEGAQLFETIEGSYYDATVDGAYVFENRLPRSRNAAYTKNERLGYCLGGLSSYDDRSWYEDVHYYEYTTGYSDVPVQVYVSRLPKAMTYEEHKSIIDRRGTYEINETQSLNIGFDDKNYMIYILDNAVTDDLWLSYTTHDVTFTADGFDARIQDVNFQVYIHGEYVEEGIRAQITIEPRDSSEIDESYIQPEAKTVEKVYPFQSAEFRRY